jgi:hypothetical protein
MRRDEQDDERHQQAREVGIRDCHGCPLVVDERASNA